MCNIKAVKQADGMAALMAAFTLTYTVIMVAYHI